MAAGGEMLRGGHHNRSCDHRRSRLARSLWCDRCTCRRSWFRLTCLLRQWVKLVQGRYPGAWECVSQIRVVLSRQQWSDVELEVGAAPWRTSCGEGRMIWRSRMSCRMSTSLGTTRTNSCLVDTIPMMKTHWTVSLAYTLVGGLDAAPAPA